LQRGFVDERLTTRTVLAGQLKLKCHDRERKSTMKIGEQFTTGTVPAAQPKGKARTLQEVEHSEL